MSLVLRDPQGREFRYLRLSVTDVCNFRCTYCLPNGFQKCKTTTELSLLEISRLLKAFSALSFKKIRLTGGEPTLRNDLPEIISEATRNGATVGLTTNGYRLSEKIESYKDAGLSLLNLSLDSTSAEKFKLITGKNEFANIQQGLEKALELGIKKIKLNTVLLKGINDQDLASFLDYVKKKPITLRFIELMQTGQNRDFFAKYHVRSNVFIKNLEEKGWQEVPRTSDAGPAIEYFHEDFNGRIGFISPYSNNFCSQCNRLRVSARGDLRLCLFGEGDISLRPYLQDDESLPNLIDFIQKTLQLKPESHFLEKGNYGDMQTLSSYGG